MPVPPIGRIVHVLVDPAENNGADVAPAVITRVWGPSAFAKGAWTVNYRILLDELATPWKTSACLHEDEESARAREHESDVPVQGMSAFWPPMPADPPPATEPTPVGPRARLVELAEAIEGRAKVALDPAALYGVAASIWEFLALHPAEETVVRPPRLAEGGTVDTKKLAQWAQQMSSRRGQA